MSPMRRSLQILSCLAACGVLMVGRVGADPLQIPIKNNSSKTISDISFKVLAGGKITDVPDRDSFQAPAATSLGKSVLTLDGGTIAPGTSTSVILDTDKVAPRYEVIGVSFTDKSKRGTSTGDDIFSLAVWGGPAGQNFAGAQIAPNEYGYFFQFDRNALFSASPTRFDVIVGAAPTASGVIGNTWSVPQLSDDLPVNLGTGDLAILNNDMLPSTMTGNAGIAPVSWQYAGGRMSAIYASNFGLGDASSVLWFTSPAAPEIGGLLGADGKNALLYAGDTLLFTNGVTAPVPEPSALWLGAVAGMVMLGLAMRRRA